MNKILETFWEDYTTDPYPINRRMKVLNEIRGMSTENICLLFNELVRIHAKGGTYLEVGTFWGRSVLSAALYNPSTRCITIDNFSQFGGSFGNLQKGLDRFNLPNIEFYNLDYKDAIAQIFEKEPDLKVDVYFYDGDHAYQHQVNGLNIMLPYLADNCVILVDDYNLEHVRQANDEFKAANPGFESVLRIRTPRNADRTWWNGIEVLMRYS